MPAECKSSQAGSLQRVAGRFSINYRILWPDSSFPLFDQLAPAEHRGAYLGASTLTTLGVAVGPLIGGVMLAMTGAGVFICTALLSLLLCAIIYVCRTRMLVRLQD